MAKKRKASSGRRRRRVGGVNKTDMQRAGLAIGGAIGAMKLTSMLKDKTGILGQAAPYVGLALGIGLPLLTKSQMVKDLSLGLLVGGGITTLQKHAPGIISGPYSVPVVSGPGRRRIMNGGVMNPGAVGNGFTPARNSVNTGLSVINGIVTPHMNGSAMGM